MEEIRLRSQWDVVFLLPTLPLCYLGLVYWLRCHNPNTPTPLPLERRDDSSGWNRKQKETEAFWLQRVAYLSELHSR